MNEYLSQLYDWISRTDNTFSSRKSRDEFISKMMNEDDYNTQIYDWVSGKDTSFSSRYTTDQFKAKTLANYTPLKKKDKSELTSQEVATESITKEATPPTLSGASKSKFDYDSFIDKDEEFALPELENELAGKGYSIEKTGLGDALLVTDNITKEQIEIDLQPISWFGKDKYRKEEIAKVKKLIETPSDVRRKALSANQLEAYSEDRATYINNLKRLYPDIGFDYVQDPSRGALLKVTKGSSVGEFPIAMGTGNDAKQFADINNFLYQNITDDEASSIIKRQNADEYKKIVEEFNKTEDKIDISMESAEADFYGKDYFKGLFKALEQSGVSVPPEAKQELEKGTITRQEYRGNTPISVEVNMGKSQIDSGVQKYFGSNPEVLAKINQYNLSGTVSVRKDKIDRAKKLAIEKFLEDSPDRETTKEILRRVNKDASEEQLRIETNLEMAKSHLEKLVSSAEQSAEQISKKYPKLKVTVIQDEKGNLVDIVSSEPVKEINDLKSEIKDASDVYMSLAYKSKYDYDKVASKAETTGQYIELANKSYDLFDTAMADINNALRQMAGSFEVITTLAEGAIEDVTGIPSAGTVTSGMSAEKRLKLAREGMAESNQKLDQAYKTQRTYQEAIKEGSKFEFATRQFATQAPNIALALATSGAGSALGMSNAGISTLVATQFGVSSAGQKYDELTTRQEIASIAEKAKKDLETVKGIMPDDEYFAQMYELERAIEDGKITPWQKTLAVTGTGLVEGLVTRAFGTVPNSIKILKDLKVKPGQFMDDILKSNYKATLGAFKEFGKRTGGEIIEETAIDALTQVNDYAFLGDQIDLSSLDDVAVTSIITSGTMNTPSMAYSTILTQTNVNRYKNKIKSLTGEITTLRDMLSDPDLTNIQRASIHNNINKIISQVADQTTNMEGDALLLGADNIKELMTLSGVRNSMLKKAGVENDDSYDVANAKIDTYLKGVDQKESKKFVDQMKYIDGRRNDILKSINYEGAVERVFGEKGKDIAKDLDPSLTPQQKYVEVYGRVRQEINDNALREFKDAIQKQETRDIPDAQRAEGVQEVEEEVRFTTEEEAAPGQKTIISGIEVTFPTEQEDTQRKETRTTNEYIDKSVSKLEVEDTDQLSKDLEGDFGILTGENPLNKALTEEENQQLNQKAQQWLKDKGYNPRMLTGKYNQGENSFFVPGLTKADAIAFAKEFNQESVAHSDGLLYQDGRVNPRDKAKDNFTLQDYTPDSNFVSIVQTNEGPKTFNIGYDFENTITPEETKIQAEVQQLRELFKAPDQRKQVENAEKALKDITPDVKIIVHESEQAYAEVTGETGRKQKTGGTYQETVVDGKVEKTIHINPDKANARTVAHEVFHAILLNMVKTDAEAQRLTEAMMKAVAKVASPELKAYLDEFASNYDENIRAEEKLAELVGKLASEYSSLPKPTQNIIKRWLDKLAKMFGLKPFTDDQVIDVLNTIAGKVSRGEAITEKDVSTLKEGKAKYISPRKQFVGVKANLTADQKSDKKKAEDMIKKGMDPLQIKQQTGFEVGADGKLRLELDASKAKEGFEGLGHSFGKTTVSEALEFPDLIKAYPFIADIPVFFNDGFPSAGLYDGVNIRMNSALINEKGNGDHLGTLLHEIQHVIQIKEGFTGGANPATIRDEVKKAVRNLNNKAINAIQTQVEKLTGIRPELTITEGDRKELTEVYENNEAALIDMLSRHTVEDVDAVVKVIRNAENSEIAVENLMEEFGMPNKEAVLLNGIHGVFDMKLYEALSGEVEARNVQNRRTMTEAERRNSLAAETETISQLVSVEDGGKFIDVPIKRSEQIRRKQVTNYDNIIKIAKENNISDAAIRQYLSENGMTLNEADALLKNYNDRIRKTRQKKEGLFTKDNKVLKILDSIRRRAAREAQRDLNVRRKELADTIKDMKTNGQITTSQSVVIINRISSVNLNNESAVDNLISYVDKVFKNAEYADKIVRSNKKRASAKKNIKSKIGSAKATFNNLNKVFSINARIIPDGVLDTYMELVDQFGARKAVLKLEEVSVVNQKAVDIINAIDTEISEIPKLQQVFDTYPDKKMKDGKIDFTATIEYMVKDGTIQREDADLMNKYKKDILPAEEKVESEPVEYTFEVKDNNVVDALDKESAQRLLDLVKKHPEALEQLSENEKKNLQGVIDNIEAGFFPSYGNNLSNEIEAIVAKDIVLPRVKNGSVYIFDRLISNVNSLGAKAYRTMFKTNAKTKTATEYSIRANPLSDIDNVLGNMNRTDIYDNVFGKASRSLQNLDTEIDIVQEKLMKAEALLNKQHKTGNKVAEAKFRIMAYMLEREYQSNRDSNKVFSAVDALEETIEFHRKESDKSIYSDKDIEILKKILEEFKSRDIDDIFKSFSNRDKQAIKLIDKVNTSLSDKALHTASVVRGNRPAMLDNYVHHSVANVDANSLETVTSKYNQFKTFSTKAGTLVERTPGVKALNFDVLNATMKGARETLTDYHMTNTAKTIFKTLNKIKSNILSDKNSTKKEVEVANALINSFDTAMRIVFEKSYSPVELGFLNNLKSIGYKALLASVPRAAAELGSNIGYVMITSPVAFTSGYKNYREYVMSQRGRDIMNKLNSEQTGKLYSKKVTGKTADIGLFVNADGISRSSAVNDIQDKANYILSFGKKAINILAEKPAEFLISTPDKAISRPLWFGSLSSKFKELTGNDIDMDAIENNDVAYLRDNKDALDKATIFADKEVTRAATSINVFNGILKNKINPNDSGTQKVFKEINGFMSNFIIYEYTTMRSGVTALIYSGEISRAEGVRLLAGATARMSMYVVLYQMLSHAFDAAVSAVIGLDIGDDEPEDMDDLFTRQLVGSVLSTIIGKNMGNIAKIGPMMGLEYINENYLQGLRDGKDFDPYKHSMSYSMLSRENIKEISSGRKGFFDVIIPAFSGPYSPMAKTITRGAIVLGRAIEGKKEETRDRAMNELKQRIALEMLGNLGLVPLYKDVRRIVLKDMFKEDEKETGEKPQKPVKYSWEKSQKPVKYSWEK